MISNKEGLLAAILLLLLLTRSNIGLAGRAKDCKVSFSTKAEPVLVAIEGRSLIGCSGSFTVSGESLVHASFNLSLSELETGIPLRNRHLRENYLHTKQFPEAKLSITKIADFADHLSGKKSGRSSFLGDLELHGSQNPITDGKFEIKGQFLYADFSIDLPDFGIEKPAFMGIKIVERIYIKVSFEIDEN